ncbi:MAG: tetratricopeptide (TPR) repeat protein [Myxococcota bacterium]|jgi:tetratricopeptide (TPR) repeat protein
MWFVVVLLLSTADARNRLRSAERELARIEVALSRASVEEIPELLLSRSGHQLRAGDAAGAVETCRQILLEYPGYERADLVRFTLASTLADLGEIAESREVFMQLLRLHSDSPLIGDALVIIGGQYFAEDQLYSAMKAYTRAVSYPDADRWLEAVYMLGWCHYNFGGPQEAIALLEQVLTWSAEHPDHPASQLRESALAALHDAGRYAGEAGDTELARRCYTRFLADWPDDPRADVVRQHLSQLTPE